MTQDQITKLAQTILRRRCAEPKREAVVLGPGEAERIVRLASAAGGMVSDAKQTQAAVTGAIDAELAGADWRPAHLTEPEAAEAFMAYAADGDVSPAEAEPPEAPTPTPPEEPTPEPAPEPAAPVDTPKRRGRRRKG